MNFGGWGTEGQTGLAYNDDITNLGGWVEEPTNPVFSLDPAYGESYMASNGSMVYKDGVYFLFYNTIKDGVHRICMATGNDVLSLTRANGGVPVIELGAPGEWDSNRTFDPMVRVSDDGTTLQLFYTGDTDGVTRSVGWTTSEDDGVTWTKQGRLIAYPPGTYHFGESSALFEGNAFTLTTDYAVVNGYRRTVQYITTDGGVTWAGPTTILEHGGVGEWDEVQVFDAMTVQHLGVAYVFYAGAPNPGGVVGLDMQIGVATMPYPYTDPIS